MNLKEHQTKQDSKAKTQNIKVINNQYNGNWTHRFPLEQLKVKRTTWSTILCWRMVVLAITLMATLSPVSEFIANLTLANVPSPIVRPTSYFPIFLLTFMVFRRSFIRNCSSSWLPIQRRWPRNGIRSEWISEKRTVFSYWNLILAY